MVFNGDKSGISHGLEIIEFQTALCLLSLHWCFSIKKRKEGRKYHIDKAIKNRLCREIRKW